MCRLLAYAGAPVRVADLVFEGDHSLYRQSWRPRELLSGSVNADGYGVAWYARGRPARIAEARPIWYDDDLRATLEAIESGIVMAALRNGTPGIPIDRSGLLPLTLDRWTFALNGFVPDFRELHMRELRAELPDELYAQLRGSSDSETLFLLALKEVREGAALAEALSATARRIKARVGSEEAQLNMVLSDGETIAAVRSSTISATNSLYVAEDTPIATGGRVLASEPLEIEGAWTPVDAHSWIEIGANGVIRAQPLTRE